MQKPILYILVFSTLLVFFFFLIWLPQYQKYSDLRTRVSIKSDELQNKERYFSNLRNIDSQLQKYKVELSKIESALPSSSNIPSVLNFIHNTAQKSGLILQKTSIGEIRHLQEGSPIIKTVLLVSLSGSYPAFKNFLSKMEINSRLIRVEEISFGAPERGDIFLFNLRIKTHSY